MSLSTPIDSSAIPMSIVVVVYNMAREAPRTLHSLSSEYQLNAAALDYEVIVVDNGSPTPLLNSDVERHGPNFRLLRIEQAAASPVAAINQAVAMARGEVIGVMIDGARIVTPGVLEYAARACALYANPVIATLGWHLGAQLQTVSTLDGYDQAAEDALLRSIGWPIDGYRLFEIAVLGGSSAGGWFDTPGESNCVFVRRETFDSVGGFDERFVSAGGGLANLDFFVRTCDLADTTLVILLGEGSFHQVHGGVTTGGALPDEIRRFRDFLPEYEGIRGKPFLKPDCRAEYLGSMPPQALKFVL